MKKEQRGKLLLLVGVAVILGAVLFFQSSDALPPAEESVPEVNIIMIDDVTCGECYDIMLLSTQFVQSEDELGMRVMNTEGVLVNSVRGQALIKEYGITETPALLFQGDAQKVEKLMSTWLQIGSIEHDGTLVLRNTPYPHKNIATGEVLGAVKVINLYDSTCTECTDGARVVDSLRAMGVFVTGAENIDLQESSAREYVEKYNPVITPMVIISSDLAVYPLVEEMKNIGMVEEIEGGEFVAVGLFPSKDLATGEIITM